MDRSKEVIGMTRFIVKSLMFISSYLPLYMLLIILDWSLVLDIYYQRASTSTFFIVGLLAVLIAISVITLILFIKIETGNYCQYKIINRPDDKVISYIFTYIVPILSLDITNINKIIVNLALVALVWGLYIKLDLFYLNPALVFMGYVTYTTDDKTIITDIPYSQLKRETGSLSGCFITNDIFIAKKKYNTA